MKKITALLLALIVALSLVLVSCGDAESKSTESESESKTELDNNKASIVGEWSGEFDISGLMAMIFGLISDTDVDLDELLLPVTLKFEDDSKFATSVDGKAFEENYKAFIESIKPVILDMNKEMLRVQAEESGISYDEMLAAFEEELGMSLEDYVDMNASRDVDFDTMLAAFGAEENSTGVYKINGDKIILNEGADEELEFTFKLDGNKLTINMEDIPEEFADFITLPITLERK